MVEQTEIQIKIKHKLGPKHGMWVLNGPKDLVKKPYPLGRPEIFRVKSPWLLPNPGPGVRASVVLERSPSELSHWFHWQENHWTPHNPLYPASLSLNHLTLGKAVLPHSFLVYLPPLPCLLNKYEMALSSGFPTHTCESLGSFGSILGLRPPPRTIKTEGGGARTMAFKKNKKF